MNLPNLTLFYLFIHLFFFFYYYRDASRDPRVIEGGVALPVLNNEVILVAEDPAPESFTLVSDPIDEPVFITEGMESDALLFHFGRFLVCCCVYISDRLFFSFFFLLYLVFPNWIYLYFVVLLQFSIFKILFSSGYPSDINFLDAVIFLRISSYIYNLSLYHKLTTFLLIYSFIFFIHL